MNPSPHGPRPVTTADGLTCLACGISTATVEHMQAHFMTKAHVEAVRRYHAPLKGDPLPKGCGRGFSSGAGVPTSLGEGTASLQDD